jgi:hypothetical protein
MARVYGVASGETGFEAMRLARQIAPSEKKHTLL